jgi:hypothetical protein
LVRKDGFRFAESYLVSPLAELEVVHEVLLTLLEDRTSFAEIRRETPGMLWTFVDGEQKEGYSAHDADPDCPPPGASRPFRVRDAVMRKMAFLHGVKFEVYWPDAVKDGVIEEFIAHLHRHPRYLIDKLPYHERWDWAGSDL